MILFARTGHALLFSHLKKATLLSPSTASLVSIPPLPCRPSARTVKGFLFCPFEVHVPQVSHAIDSKDVLLPLLLSWLVPTMREHLSFEHLSSPPGAVALRRERVFTCSMHTHSSRSILPTVSPCRPSVCSTASRPSSCGTYWRPFLLSNLDDPLSIRLDPGSRPAFTRRSKGEERDRLDRDVWIVAFEVGGGPPWLDGLGPDDPMRKGRGRTECLGCMHTTEEEDE